MNTLDMLEYSHLLLLNTLDKLRQDEINVPGVYGIWTIKDTIAHLASYEALTLDVLTSLGADHPTPVLDRWLTSPRTFDNEEIAARSEKSFDDVLREYNEIYAVVIDQLIHTPETRLREVRRLQGYSGSIKAEDFLIHISYEHKLKHCAHIMAFRQFDLAEDFLRANGT
jgi:hypothetical protein